MKEDSALVEEQKAKENPYNIDNEEFFALPAELFVLQLTAVSSEPVLGQYLESISYDKKKIRIYKIRRNNNDWLVVTYGLFDTIDEARKAAASIAPNAWAKSISVIQQQILAFDHAKPK
jgi:septal ring-binding cell division protein DamX